MHQYKWYLSRSSFGWRVQVYKGSIVQRTHRRILSEWWFRRKKAIQAAREILQYDMDKSNVWRVSEGGNSPVSNNYSVKPYIRGIIMPNGEEMPPYDFWPKSWGREPSCDELEGKNGI